MRVRHEEKEREKRSESQRKCEAERVRQRAGECRKRWQRVCATERGS